MKKKERAKRTKAVIIEAAFRTIAENSISGASMALISESANVSKPLLHYHFKTKAALLEQVLEFVLERLLEIPTENISKKLGSMEEFQAIFQRYRRTMTSEPELLVVFFDFWVQSIKLGDAGNNSQAFRRISRLSVSDRIGRYRKGRVFR